MNSEFAKWEKILESEGLGLVAPIWRSKEYTGQQPCESSVYLRPKLEEERLPARSEINQVRRRLPPRYQKVLSLLSEGASKRSVAFSLGVTQPAGWVLVERVLAAARVISTCPPVGEADISDWVSRAPTCSISVGDREKLIAEYLRTWRSREAGALVGLNRGPAARYVRRGVLALPDHPVSAVLRVARDHGLVSGKLDHGE